MRDYLLRSVTESPSNSQPPSSEALTHPPNSSLEDSGHVPSWLNHTSEIRSAITIQYLAVAGRQPIKQASLGSKALLPSSNFELPPALTDLMLEIDCFSMDLSGPSPQRLTVFCNGAHVGTHLILSRSQVAVIIPRDLCAARKLHLELVPAQVEVPRLAGRNADERALSIGVYSISLFPAKKASAA